ncbi:hypothetical protein FHS14_006324 [Paenibacillus baekrokdamisoli]|nr:hypothetical protein [Paenibacillus baekrokdamisoli]
MKPASQLGEGADTFEDMYSTSLDYVDLPYPYWE